MLKKGLAVAVILLFIGVAFAPSINASINEISVDTELFDITSHISYDLLLSGQDFAASKYKTTTINTFLGGEILEKTSIKRFDGNILYVGGNGPNNYSSIQEAINDAVDGDTVFVYDDSSPYYEYLEIEKSINLIGENTNTTIIDGQDGDDILILIWNSEVKVSGFTLRNGYYGMWIGSSNNTISNIYVHETIFGIHLFESNYNIIQNSTFDSNNNEGVLLFPSSNENTIINNHFLYNNFNGISVWDHCHNNIIKNNTFSHNSMVGISVHQSNNNKIIGNKILNQTGIGIHTFLSSNNEIMDNYICDGTQDGFSSHSCSNTIIKNNTIMNNQNEGISLETHQETAFNHTVCNNILINNRRWGVYLRWAENNLIYNNTVINSTYGILVASDYFSKIRESDSNVIQRNSISDNDIGIYLRGDQYDEHMAFVKDNDIYNNIIKNNDYGMYLTFAKDNLIYHNNFYNNTDEQAYDDNVNCWYYPLVNEGNYWNDFDESGEGAYDDNGDGIVDSPYEIPGGDNLDSYPLINPYNNLPPRKPSVPSGPISGRAGEQYTYTSNTTDPEGDMIFYWFYWDDSTEGDWVGPFESGETGSDSHTWREGEIYHVRVKAMDVHGEKSPWSEPMQIQLTGPNVEIGDIRGGIGVKVQIMNIGDEDISLVKWSLKYDAGLVWRIFYPFDKSKEGVIPKLKAGKTKTIWGFVFGFGNCVLTVTAEKESVTQRFDVIGPFVRIIR